MINIYFFFHSSTLFRQKIRRTSPGICVVVIPLSIIVELAFGLRIKEKKHRSVHITRHVHHQVSAIFRLALLILIKFNTTGTTKTRHAISCVPESISALVHVMCVKIIMIKISIYIIFEKKKVITIICKNMMVNIKINYMQLYIIINKSI